MISPPNLARVPRTISVRTSAIAVAVAAFAVVVWGGYAEHWKWTGLSGSVTLWDWLVALALPLALATAPLLVRRRHRLTRTHTLLLWLGLATFAALVVAGYLLPLSWTGFTGNTLWDWLELALLPLVVATSSLWASVGELHRRHRVTLAAGVGVFAVLAVFGYLIPLSWTGFSGNTLWDWLKLLLVPLLVPTLLVPLLVERLDDRLPPD